MLLRTERLLGKGLALDNWRSLGQILAGLPMRACDGKPAGERALNPAGVTGGNKTHRPYPAGAEGGEQRSRIGMEVASRVDCRGYERVGLGLTPKGASTHEIPPAGRRAEEVPHGWKLIVNPAWRGHAATSPVSKSNLSIVSTRAGAGRAPMRLDT